jgi:hypothetical protein
MSRWDAVLAYVEAIDPAEAFQRLMASEDPFAGWLKEKITELNGCGVNRLRSGSSPELIFEHPGESEAYERPWRTMRGGIERWRSR